MSSVFAHFGPIPLSLKDVPVPEVPGLLDGPDPIIVDKEKALVLGKALFWDMNVGSDGVACASCHFHAGADSRIKNQLAPDAKTPNANNVFDLDPAGNTRGPNHILTLGDFPFHQVDNPVFPNRPVIYSTDDVVSSSGSFGGEFRDIQWFGPSDDQCERAADPVFHVGSRGTRRVEPRHAPSVINAVFNHRNLWDGRANNVFNGSSAWGDRDPDAGAWINTTNGLVKERLRLINSSLASQAVMPPLDAIEMGCDKRRFADLGRKLMYRRPLEKQIVHWNDSVLGPYSNSTPGNEKKGLNTYYFWLVRDAFNAKYWSSWQRGGELGAPEQYGWRRPLPYDQFESNFGMFFALALQLYQSILISDDSPFDRSARDEQGLPIDLSPEEQAGLAEFRVAHCSLCHIGPLMSSATVVTNAALAQSHPEAFGNDIFAISTSSNVVTRMSVQKESAEGDITTAGSILDTGFTSTGVARSNWDPGLGGKDPFGNPLSYAEQYLEWLAGNNAAVVDEDVLDVRPCDFDIPLAMNIDGEHDSVFASTDGIVMQEQDTEDCYNPDGAYIPSVEAAQQELNNPETNKMLAGVNGAFKVPGLRNIDLTGPYMHNGSMATLEEVMEFYTRGGNFETDSKNFGFVFPQALLAFLPERRDSIIAFLKTLTDERVRYEKAPFDHPELIVPHGHVGDEEFIEEASSLAGELAADEYLYIPAVGAEGREEPLQRFDELLQP